MTCLCFGLDRMTLFGDVWRRMVLPRSIRENVCQEDPSRAIVCLSNVDEASDPHLVSV